MAASEPAGGPAAGRVLLRLRLAAGVQPPCERPWLMPLRLSRVLRLLGARTFRAGEELIVVAIL